MVNPMKGRSNGWWWIGGLGLAWLLAGPLSGVAPGADAGNPDGRELKREPVIRHVDRQRDHADLERIWYYRKKLPEPYYRRNNFGWARADIAGLDKQEYFAHSGIQSLDGFSKRVAKRLKGMSFSPAKDQAKFKTLFVDYRGVVDSPDALPRYFDTEYKMLEEMAARLPDTGVAGNIRLYTNLEPCPSCRGVMEQFLAMYTNIQMEVIYEWPP